MSRKPVTPFARLAALLLAFSIVGCNQAITGEGSENEQNEVPVTVLALGLDYVDADDAIRYEVTDATQYEGLTGFADIAVGDLIHIEFEEIANSSNRRALEIEVPGPNDD